MATTPMQWKRDTVPAPLILIFAVGATLLSLLTANPWLTGLALAILPMGVGILWRRGEPPIFPFILLLHWMAICTGLIYANIFGIRVEELYNERLVGDAIVLSSVGLMALALGVWTALYKLSKQHSDSFFLETASLSPLKLFRVYLIAFVACGLLAGVAYKFGSIRQIVIALLNLKWVFLFIFAMAVLQQKRDYSLLVFVIVLEFGFGLLGFFSAFKNVFFLLLVILLAGKVQVTRLLIIGIIGLFLFVIGSGWSAIKVEYRDFLNKGEQRQVVSVSVEDRLSKLGSLVFGLDAKKMAEGSQKLVERVSYVDYFSRVLRTVPDLLPHENGLLWREAVEHVLKPRFLFPSKVAIDDSERTSYYSGELVAGAEHGTSISMGYMAESYIDFGRYGMFIPLFLLGIVLGGIYRYFVARSRVKVIGFGMATAILVFGAYNYETSNIKLLGGLITSFLVLALVERLFGPQIAHLLGFRSPSSLGRSPR